MKMTATDDEGMDSLVSDKSDSPPQDQSVDHEEKEQMEESAIVPLKVLSPNGQPLKEGEEITVTVKAMHGEDEVEIVCAPKKEPGSGQGEISPEDELDNLGKEE